MASFKKTEKQQEAIKLLAGPARRIMLYGGSRSGKTAIFIYSLFIRSIKKKAGTLFSGLGLITQRLHYGMIPCQR